MERNLAMARRIARMAEKAGGRVYFVGGFVRDSVMGRESKDVDIEIHRMTADVILSNRLKRPEKPCRQDWKN